MANLIQSIERAFKIIDCFNESNYKLSLNELSEKLDLNINTTRGIVKTLVYYGYLDHDEEQNKYSLGLIFIPKAEIVNSNSIERIKKLMNPYLNLIAEKFNVSARLQLISNRNIFTVDTVNPKDSRYILLTKLNTEFPLNATSSGKIYLTFMEENDRKEYLNNFNKEKYTSKTIIKKEELMKEIDFINENGYSCEYEEIGIGISSIALPIMNDHKKLIGTISITASSKIIKNVSEEAVNYIKDIINETKDKFVYKM